MVEIADVNCTSLSLKKRLERPEEMAPRATIAKIKES